MAKKKKGKKKEKSSEEIQRSYAVLAEKTENVLSRFVKEKWIEVFYFTEESQGPFCVFDGKGIDLLWSFKPNGEGMTGWTGAQQKTNRKDVARHFKKYPCVPLYLLSLQDNEALVEYILLTLILECRSFNLSRKQRIENRHKFLYKELKMREIKRLTKRVWLNWKSRRT